MNKALNKNETQVVATFTNDDEAMKSYVTVGNMGFHVSLQDLDSGEFVPFVRAFPDVERAIVEAKKAANIKEAA